MVIVRCCNPGIPPLKISGSGLVKIGENTGISGREFPGISTLVSIVSFNPKTRFDFMTRQIFGSFMKMWLGEQLLALPKMNHAYLSLVYRVIQAYQLK